MSRQALSANGNGAKSGRADLRPSYSPWLPDAVSLRSLDVGRYMSHRTNRCPVMRNANAHERFEPNTIPKWNYIDIRILSTLSREFARQRLTNLPNAHTRSAMSRRRSGPRSIGGVGAGGGFEPTQCQDGSLVPFRLATPAQGWSREWELNPRPRDYRSRALPTELSLDTKFKLVPGARVEPA